MNWYQINSNNQIEKEASKKNVALGSLVAAILFIMNGNTIQEASEKFRIGISQLRDAYLKYKNGPKNLQQGKLADYSVYINRLKQEEGFRSKPYYCPKGHLTIGYGHKILPNEKFTSVTIKQAEQMLGRDAAKAWNEAQSLLKGKNVEPQVLEIVAEMCFQMGKDGVKNFGRFWKALSLEQPDYMEAAKEMRDSQWHRKDSPQRAEELAQKMESFANITPQIAELNF